MENGKQSPKDLRQAYRISYLLAGHIKNTLTVPERNELDTWVAESDHNLKLFEELTNKDYIEKNLASYNQADIEKALKESKEYLAFNAPSKRKRLRLLILVAIILVAAFFSFTF